MEISIGHKTHIGKYKEKQGETHNEDYVLVKDKLCAVFDGMGGPGYGEIASKTAAEVIERFDPASVAEECILRSLEETILDAHKAVKQKSEEIQEPGEKKMGTTVTAIVIEDDRVYLGNVGNSPAYLIYSTNEEGEDIETKIAQISEDHSKAAELIKNGLDPKTAFEEAGWLLKRALGPEKPNVYLKEIPIQDGDTILLCTDGLVDRMRDENYIIDTEKIKEIVTSHGPMDACNILVDIANEAGGEDNISIIVLKFKYENKIDNGIDVTVTEISKSPEEELLDGIQEQKEENLIVDISPEKIHEDEDVKKEEEEVKESELSIKYKEGDGSKEINIQLKDPDKTTRQKLSSLFKNIKI